MSIPTHMQAVVAVEGKEIAVQTVAVPSIANNEVLVQVKAAAQNPTDWKHVAFGLSQPGNIVGCDYAGVVVKVGTDVKNVKIGDRVAGFVHGARKNDLGSYAEYLRTEYDLVWSVPDGTSFEEAAAIGGVGSETAALALYHALGLPWPGTSSAGAPRTVLVWAGSTSVGLYAIQLAKASGATVVTTGSPHNHELLKSLGAAGVFDYKSPTVVQDIKQAYPDIDAGLDCISEQGSTKQAAASFGKPGTITTLLPVKKEGEGWNPDVEIEPVLAYYTRGKAFEINGIVRPAVPEQRAHAVKWLSQQGDLVKSGQLKANPIKIIPGGLHGVKEGFELMKAGKVSAQKLVYQVGT
ncbi:GroES-like protein [Mycena maculata]|uniref:GroES-like protein n=1 Tax=Mycena maculata TaxID=230809 RepID=A0AAD7ITJ9_9AGAR|nr:GroES-like protein [Mycena maculata]